MTDSAASEYAQSADWYDRMYAHMGKDYAAEAEVVAGIVRARMPGARSLLDVGCGTGLHMAALAEHFDEVAGVDLDAKFVARARERSAGAVVRVGDMRTFDLGRRFDVVASLFSAIGHVGGVGDLNAAVARMAAHLAPGGVLVVEPWFAPEAWRDGRYGVEVAELPGSTLVRVNHSASDGEVSVLTFAWTEVTARGVTRLDETLRLTRFTREQYAAAFAAAGLDVTFEEQGLGGGGRGLWIGLLDR